MIEPLNCDECKMQYRCTHISADCKYPEGRQYGVTTYDKMRADERSALEKRLEEAEKVIDEFADGLNWQSAGTYEGKPSEVLLWSGWMRGRANGPHLARLYRAKYPKGGE